MRRAVKTLAICLAAALTAAVAVLASLAANAATAHDRWPGVLDAIRASPWPWVGGLGAGAVALAVTAALISGGPTAAAQDPPPPVAPVAPAWVVDRAESRRAAAAVCARKAEAVGITTALEGAGGFGKTTLATLVCANRRVRRRFRGRVYTVTLGRDVRGRAAIAAKVAETTAFITGDTTAFEHPELAGEHLGRLLERRPRTLIVLDDVWEPEQLAPFLRGGKNCVRLVTTRVPAILPEGAERLRVDEMSPEQARTVLTWELPELPDETVTGLLRATGRWALLLRLTNRLIARQIATGADAAAAARDALEGLRTGGPAAGEAPPQPLDLDDPARRSRAVRATIEASTTLLSDGGSRRLAELAVFVEDESIPVPIVVQLWQATGGLTEPQARDLCAQLDRFSLVALSPENGGRITLHDVLRDYLREELGAAELRRLNAVLVDAALTADWLAIQEGYLLDHTIEHLLAAGQTGRAELIAGDIRWVEARLHQRGPTALVSDLARIPTSTAAALAGDLTRVAHLLTPMESDRILTAVLHSRLAELPHWDRQIALRQAAHPGLRPLLANHWPLPDLPDAAPSRVLAHPVLSVAIGPDGAWVATGDARGEVVIQDPGTGAVLARERDRTGRAVRAMAPGPDGSSLIVGVGRSVLRIDPLAGGPTERLFTALDEILDVATAPDGSWCAAADGRGFTYADRGTSVFTLGPGPDFTRTLRGLPTRPFAVEPPAGTGHRFPPWDPAARRPLAVAPDGRRLATAGPGDRVRVWDVASRTVPTQILLTSAAACAAAFSPRGDFLLTADTQGNVRRWDLVGRASTMMRSEDSSTLLTRHSSAVTALAVAPCGTWAAWGDEDGAVCLWNLSRGRRRAVLTGHAGAVAGLVVAPDGSWLVTVDRGGEARRWETPTERPVAPVDAGHRPVAAVAYAPDGSHVAAQGSAAVRLYGAEDGATSLRLDSYGWQEVFGPQDGQRLAFAPDGTWLAFPSSRREIDVWDLAAGCVKASMNDQGFRVSAVAAAPDGSWLALAGHDGNVRLCDRASGEQLAVLTGDGRVRSVAVSPDATWLASGGDSGVVTVWDLATRTRRNQLTGGTGAVLTLSVSPDGNWLFGGGADGTLRLWNPRTGAYRGLRTGSDSPLHAVAASPDGRWIATAGEDATVRVWDRRGGQVVAAQRTEGPLRSCSWRPDSRGLAVGGDRGLYVYRLLPA
ncbi:NB-ARC domain-containing protein [Streptomyces aurantiacus]|uniref:NB-ARC domain-containing protein n=1 Tax=Streptomyces aurantiacus TaxID=47760 RepID=UPI0009970D1E|nr:NB-ARC domain-containing protein [Streptomyces aurantiacus]